MNDFILLCQQKIQKMSCLGHFNGYNSRTKYNLTNDTIFLMCCLSSIHWYISFLHFKTIKIHLTGSFICIMFWSVKYTFTCQRFVSRTQKLKSSSTSCFSFPQINKLDIVNIKTYIAVKITEGKFVNNGKFMKTKTFTANTYFVYFF